jgi:hypothetical protein
MGTVLGKEKGDLQILYYKLREFSVRALVEL